MKSIKLDKKQEEVLLLVIDDAIDELDMDNLDEVAALNQIKNKLQGEAIKLNAEIADGYLKVLKEASGAWFYGYHWSKSDQARLDEAIGYFNNAHDSLKKKAA